MRLQEHVGHDYLASELRMFPFVARIGMVANVKPWPAIESAGPDTADVIRRQIVADLVPLVRAHPELVCARPKGDAHGVANSPGINFLLCAIGIELENPGAIR